MERPNLPVLGKGSTKELMIELLSERWPLSARKIAAQLKKKHALPITYQAVHKSLQELTKDEVLAKTKEGYQVSESWIDHLSSFSTRIKNEYEKLKNVREVRTVQKLTFMRHSDFVKFHFEFIEKLLSAGEMADMTFHMRHVIYPFILSGDDYRKVRKMLQKIRWTILSKNDTPMDRWCARYWKKLGVTVKTGVETATDAIMIVTGDYITNVYLPRKAKQTWDKVFSSATPEKFDMKTMNEVTINDAYKTLVTVIKDREIARLLRG